MKKFYKVLIFLLMPLIFLVSFKFYKCKKKKNILYKIEMHELSELDPFLFSFFNKEKRYPKDIKELQNYLILNNFYNNHFIFNKQLDLHVKIDTLNSNFYLYESGYDNDNDMLEIQYYIYDVNFFQILNLNGDVALIDFNQMDYKRFQIKDTTFLPLEFQNGY